MIYTIVYLDVFGMETDDGATKDNMPYIHNVT